MTTVFESGAIRDDQDGKVDFVESVSWLALERFCRYMKTKESKYGRGNWMKGIPVDSYERSLMRHLHKYIANKYQNGNFEINEDHLSAAMFNLQGIMHEQERQRIYNERNTV